MCDCPAADATLSHQRADHAHDCHDGACGACWGCARDVARDRQLLVSRGSALPAQPLTRVAFTTHQHDETHTLVGARDHAGAYRICVTCVHLRMDGKAS